MHSYLSSLLNILLPQRCLHCSAYGERLCGTCISHIEPAPDTSAQWIHAVLSYRASALKRTLWELKYRERISLAEPLGGILADYLLEELADDALWKGAREVMLVPIPLSRKRKKERGYNHAALLARAAKKRLTPRHPHHKIPHDRETFYDITVEEKALTKTRETPTQMSLDTRAKRLKNLAGAFAVENPEILQNKTIVLIDDITTTGATLREARKTLRKAGVKNIIAITVAH